MLVPHPLKKEDSSMENKDIKPIFYGNHRTRKLLSKDLGKLTITSASFADSLLENKKKILEIGFGDGGSIIELERKKSQYYYCIESYHKGIQNLNNHLSTLDDFPDLIVRTGGYKRLSNFMLWQSCYSELEFLDILWPEISEHDIGLIFDRYLNTKRNFGRIKK